MNNGISIWAFVLAVVVGIAWALGSRIVDALWPRKGMS